MTEPRLVGRAVRLELVAPRGPLAHQVIIEYDIYPVRDTTPIGWIRAYATAPTDPRCYLEIELQEDYRGKFWPMESLALMLDFLLLHSGLRAVHLEATELALQQWLHGAEELVVEKETYVFPSGEEWVGFELPRATWEHCRKRRWWLKKLAAVEEGTHA